MIIAQLTDLHLRPRGKLAYGRVDAAKMFADAIATLTGLKAQPDVVLFTGDITDCGLIEEYQVFVDLISPLDIPVFVIPGNHDRRENMKTVLTGHDYLHQSDGPCFNYVIKDYPVTFVGLDTVVPGQGYGIMDEPRLQWLEKTLESVQDKPAIVFMHHPPFLTGIHHMDKINCRGGEEMARIIRQYPNVERVIAGHHHRSVTTSFGGSIGSIAPSIAHQVLLDFTKTSYADAMISMEPPAFHLHMWQQGAGLVTHQVYVGSFPGPYPFNLDPDYPAYKASPVSE